MTINDKNIFLNYIYKYRDTIVNNYIYLYKYIIIVANY